MSAWINPHVYTLGQNMGHEAAAAAQEKAADIPVDSSSW